MGKIEGMERQIAQGEIVEAILAKNRLAPNPYHEGEVADINK